MRKRWVVLIVVVGALAALTTLAAVRVKRQAAVAVPAPSASAKSHAPRPQQPSDLVAMIYDGKLASGWEDWGWGQHDLSAGPAQVRFAKRGGIILHHPAQDWRFGGVVFRYKAPTGWGEFLTVEGRPAAGGRSLPTVKLQRRHVIEQPDGWVEAFVPYDELNPDANPFVGIVIAAHVDTPDDWVLLDKIALTKPPESFLGPAPAQSPAQVQTLRVRCDASTRAIDPRIYGAASDDWSSGQTARRFGGNPYSRINFELGVWNTGSDWFFENVGGGKNLFETVEADAKQGRSAALVVPILGFVAKDARSVGFPRSKFGAQRKHDPQRPEAGDGYSVAGKPLTPADPTLTGLPAPPELIGKWVRKLREADAARGSRSVQLYILDNEPSLWDETHRDVHPKPVGYDELLDRTVRYAKAVREADPEGLIAGPAEWGWTGYFYSAVDRHAGFPQRPDRLEHGDVPLIPWYLARLAEREKVDGKRLLDVLDVHFYPMASGVYGSGERVDAQGAALRLRSTRALWDPSYRDESWINETVQLIPRLKRWVAESYPGTKTAIGEWSFGGERHISGALATAEALGRFGEQGLDAAYHWGGLAPDMAPYWAFRAFRNFDGQGGRFQDVSLAVEATTDVSLFASRDEASKHFVLVILNKSAVTPVNAKLDLSSCGRVASSRMFSYAAGSTKLAEAAPPASDAKGLRASLSPYSITVLDLTVEPPPR